MFHSSTSHTYHHNSSWTIKQARDYLCRWTLNDFSVLLDAWLNYTRTVVISKTKDTSFEIKSFMCVKLVYMCKVVHVRQSSLCAFVVSLMNQQQKTSKAINYFNWKVLIYCVLSVGRKWVCGPSPLIQHAFQCKNQFGFSRHLSNWRYLEVLYFHVR